MAKYCSDFPENQLTENTVWTIKTKPGGGSTTLGGGTAISSGGPPDTDGGTRSRLVAPGFKTTETDR